jgi:CHAT domain-containing protein
LHTLLGEAKALDRNIVISNENNAIESSKVWDLDSIKQAVNLFTQTAEDWEKLNEPKRAAFCLNETAKLAQMYSDYETAFRALDRAIELETENSLFEEKVISLSLYSLFSVEKSDKKKSRKYSDQALGLSERSSSTKAKAYSLFCSGMYAYYYGKMTDAIVFFEQANTFAQKTQDIYILSQALYYVGFSYLRDGKPYKAVDIMNQALDECKKYDYQKGIALSYFGIAFVNYYISEKQKALDFFKKSDSLIPANFEWMEKARIVNMIGLIYMQFGELDVAESNFQKAVAYYEKANYLLGKITTSTLLAETYLLKSDLDKAKQTYEFLAALSAKIDDKFRLASIKEGLGNVEYRKNKFDAAIKSYLEALNIYKNIGVKLPGIENLLGNAYKQNRDYQTARNYYNSALRTTRQTKDFLQLSNTLFNLASLDVIENNTDQALINIKESIDLTENLYSDVSNANLKRAYLSTVFDRYELYINLLMKMQRKLPDEHYALRALQAAEKSRARSMLEKLSLSEANFNKDADPETVKRENEIRILLNIKADKLTDLLSQNTVKDEIEKISTEIKELEHELEEIKANLKKSSPFYSAIKNPATFDAGELQNEVLDENSLLLEFFFGEEESYLWLVSKNEVVSYVLPPRQQIESQVENLLKLLSSREMGKDEKVEDYQKRIARAESDYWRDARNLSNELFGQIAGKITNKRLIIVPDGKLHYFPVFALPLPYSDLNEPILLTNETIYGPSAQMLSLLTKSSNQMSQPAKNLLIFSDPVFSGEDPRISAADKSSEKATTETALTGSFRFAESLNALPRLTASRDESDAIINIVGSSKADVFTGFSANRERLLNAEVSNYKIIHFATHGLVNEERSELSGIVLSGFDETGNKINQLVRLQDIYGLNLSSDLVVLSACNTSIGKEIKGEGLMSLNNAFLQSGAKSVISSFWKVDDYATLELMKNFYAGVVDETNTPSEALRQAQLKMMQNPRYSSPFYWASFNFQGNYRQTPPFLVTSSGSLIYLLIPLLPIFLIAIYGWYKFSRK